MKPMVNVFLIIICICLSNTFIRPAEAENLEQFYSKYVDKYIEKCMIKEQQLSNSCMPTITQYAAVNCLRASFVAYYKGGIVSSLIANDVGKKDYKINQHVNSIFLKVFKRAIGDIEEAEELVFRAREQAKDKQ